MGDQSVGAITGFGSKNKYDLTKLFYNFSTGKLNELSKNAQVSNGGANGYPKLIFDFNAPSSSKTTAGGV